MNTDQNTIYPVDVSSAVNNRMVVVLGENTDSTVYVSGGEAEICARVMSRVCDCAVRAASESAELAGSVAGGAAGLCCSGQRLVCTRRCCSRVLSDQTVVACVGTWWVCRLLQSIFLFLWQPCRRLQRVCVGIERAC